MTLDTRQSPTKSIRRFSQLAATVALLSRPAAGFDERVAVGSNFPWGKMQRLGRQFSAERLVNSQRKTGPLCSSRLHKGPA
jgi:hypothetical protein